MAVSDNYPLMGLRIEQRRKELNLTLQEVAAEVGVAASTIQRYEKGRFGKIKLPVIEAIATALRVNPEWLTGDTDEPVDYDDPDLIASIPLSYMELCKGDVRQAYKAMQAIDDENSKSLRPSNILPMPKMRKVPLLGAIACGSPILAQENLDGEVDIPAEINADFALRCKGDSMINARIFDGDTVYIRQQEEVEHGEIAAVLVGEEATLKRVYLFDDHISLEAENPQYRPMVYWGEDMNGIRILGKAVAFTSTVR